MITGGQAAPSQGEPEVVICVNDFGPRNLHHDVEDCESRRIVNQANIA